jgi:hypothetical protein
MVSATTAMVAKCTVDSTGDPPETIFFDYVGIGQPVVALGETVFSLDDMGLDVRVD